MEQAPRMRPEARRGFTLVELLLTVGLLLLLAGAVIFSFSSLQRGAGLEEGATRLEALLRFARSKSVSKKMSARVFWSPSAVCASSGNPTRFSSLDFSRNCRKRMST